MPDPNLGTRTLPQVFRLNNGDVINAIGVGWVDGLIIRVHSIEAKHILDVGWADKARETMSQTWSRQL